jgi:Ni/Co efflux regulator RcnB
MRTLLFTIVLCASALAPVACSERDQAETHLEPWDSPEAGGAKAAWQRTIKQRTHYQNSYDRTR